MALSASALATAIANNMIARQQAASHALAAKMPNYFDWWDASLPLPVGWTAALRSQMINSAIQGANDFASDLSAAIVAHLTSNAVVTVTVGTSTSGLQSVPSPNTSGTATAAPASPVTLVGSLT